MLKETREKLDELYRNLYSVDSSSVNRSVYSERINELLMEIELNRDLSVVEKYALRMANKSFMKNLRSFILGKDLDDITIAKLISSNITHSLIEMEKGGIEAFIELDLSNQSKLLSSFILGEVSKDEIREYYRQFFGTIK